MTTKKRLEKLESTVPPNVTVNPYAAMSDAEILQALKAELESGATSKEAENILANNGIEWTVKL
jgi:hypothetical protein